jgi:hypothetical protein
VSIALPFLSFVDQISYLPEMTIVRLCNVPLQLKLVAGVANFCGQWPYIEYLVMSYSSAVKFDLGQFY